MMHEGDLGVLKAALRAMQPAAFEALVSGLLGDMIDVTFAQARAGDQGGAMFDPSVSGPAAAPKLGHGPGHAGQPASAAASGHASPGR